MDPAKKARDEGYGKSGLKALENLALDKKKRAKKNKEKRQMLGLYVTWDVNYWALRAFNFMTGLTSW